MNSKLRSLSSRPLIALLVGFVLQHSGVTAQQQVVENSVFWEVSGNGLSKPSYLFGTFHLMGNLYVDSLHNVADKLSKSEAIVGELIIDNTITAKVMTASYLKGTTLDNILSPDTYNRTAEWLKEVSGYDLKFFNSMNPITIQIILMTIMQQKYYPMDTAKDIPMDIYFQKYGKRYHKKVIGLETVEDQIQALYGQFTIERQAQLLTDYVTKKDKAHAEMVNMNKYYRQGNLAELEKLMSDQTYDAAEANAMLDNRNKKWVMLLPSIFSEHTTFVAVGALHLSGTNGLVNLLRQQGYSVKPVRLK